MAGYACRTVRQGSTSRPPGRRRAASARRLEPEIPAGPRRRFSFKSKDERGCFAQERLRIIGRRNLLSGWGSPCLRRTRPAGGARVRPESGGRAHPAETEYTRCCGSGVERTGSSRVVLSAGAAPRACPDDSTTPGAAPSQMRDHRGSPLRHCDNVANGADVPQSATVSQPHPGSDTEVLSP